MPDFKEIQGNLQNAKRSRAQSFQSVFLFEEKLKKLLREKESLLRSNDVESEIMQRILSEEKNVKQQIAMAKGKLEVSTSYGYEYFLTNALLILLKMSFLKMKLY
ncbi:MAG: hypothetical protein WAT92_12765 [Saprospiraceae bacterium]